MSMAFNSEIVSSASLREAMRHLVSGVCVVTAGLAERRTGATVTSATSLSVDPPTMVVCIGRSASVLAAIRLYRHFCINVLGARHQQLAERFAGQAGIKGAARYVGSPWSEVATGAPTLDDALAVIDCTLDREIDWHSHSMVLGAVKGVRVTGGAALVYSHGQYGSYSCTQVEQHS
jgi:3-hydroxy-9,10-secoandrosta-1,3,5(10)-triene-9,17-dione monooxygenase reductase component